VKTEYVLITAVHNEKELIESVIKSVVSQTILPKKWVIVDDASTDGTEEIIKRYEAEYDFIVYHRLQRSNIESYYACRTQAFLAGYEESKIFEYDFVGNLDADISLEPIYYERILEEFDKNPRLGIASGVYVDKINNRLQKVPIAMSHSPGAIQMFRRECYKTIGGYIPQKYGGDDACAEIMARMNGWQTRSFSQYEVIHHRPWGTGERMSILQARFRQGLTEYGVATHPLFMVAKSFRRAFLEKPYLIGSLVRLAGFVYGYWLREERKIPPEAIRFVRREQIRRLVAYACRNC